jgi:hypothetical protein
MKDYNDYRILKYQYKIISENMEEYLWKKMNEKETKWAVQLTLEGVNESSESKTEAVWDIFFIDSQTQNKIEKILNKYKIEYEITDLTESFLSNFENFPKKFMERLNEELQENLSTDEILDKIIDHGVKSLNVFENYYLENKTN